MNLATILHPQTITSEALRAAVLRLQEARIESASLDARLLLEHVLGYTREQLLLAMDDTMPAGKEAQYRALVEKRARRQPIAQLIGRREFWGMNFVVSEHTLDPRPDSESVIEAVLERIKNRANQLKILDLGTGTGCLLLSLLSELPAANGTGVDICERALGVAKENALALGLAPRVSFVRSDWCERLEGEFDIILANPHYIEREVIPTLDPEVSQFEPKGALDGGADGLDCYRAIIKALPKVLAKDGLAAFEIGMGQERSLAAIAEENGLMVSGVKQDLGGIIRCVVIQHQR